MYLNELLQIRVTNYLHRLVKSVFWLSRSQIIRRNQIARAPVNYTKYRQKIRNPLPRGRGFGIKLPQFHTKSSVMQRLKECRLTGQISALKINSTWRHHETKIKNQKSLPKRTWNYRQALLTMQCFLDHFNPGDFLVDRVSMQSDEVTRSTNDVEVTYI